MAQSDKAVEALLKKIGAKLKRIRVKAGYTSFEKFAFAHELDSKQYWRMESGENITLKSLIKVLRIHKISLEKFFRGFKDY